LPGYKVIYDFGGDGEAPDLEGDVKENSNIFYKTWYFVQSKTQNISSSEIRSNKENNNYK
jgi:hypothetical protein